MTTDDGFPLNPVLAETDVTAAAELVVVELRADEEVEVATFGKHVFQSFLLFSASSSTALSLLTESIFAVLL